MDGLMLGGLTVLLGSLLFGKPAVHAQERPGPWGLGVHIGTPTGLTLRASPRPKHALDLLLAWRPDTFLRVYGHALVERPLDASSLRFYLGPGVMLGLRDRPAAADDLVLAGTTMAGLNFYTGRFGVFLQLIPRLDVLPALAVYLDGGVGLRYYFRHTP